MSANSSAEPAVRSYFFGKGYRDLQETIIGSWRRNLASAKQEFGEGGRLWSGELPDKGLSVLRWTAGISVVLFGTVFFALFSLLHVVVLMLFFLLIYIGFSLVYLAERIYLLSKQFFTVCPECHSKRPLPEYFCPSCNAIHSRLIPSSYGILKRTCTCGEKIPATFFLGRGRLQARCADCKELLSQVHTESRKSFVPIFGGPAVGKSAFLFSAVHDFIDQALPVLGMTSSFGDSRTQADFEAARLQMEVGKRPTKTVNPLPRAFNLQIETAGESRRMLYLYDPAGEAFLQTEGMVLHSYQKYLSGLIFLVDPFGLPDVRRELHVELALHEEALRPSKLAVEDALARVLISMEEHFGLKKDGRIKVPVAVVLNKVDACGLDERVGEAALRRRLQGGSPAADTDALRNELVRSQLLLWNQGDLVHQLETRCMRLGYFACSSLGRLPDDSGQPFEGRSVLEPLLWILSHVDSSFAAAR